jgi:hypothetical protein
LCWIFKETPKFIADLQYVLKEKRWV